MPNKPHTMNLEVLASIQAAVSANEAFEERLSYALDLQGQAEQIVSSLRCCSDSEQSAADMRVNLQEALDQVNTLQRGLKALIKEAKP